MRAAWGSLSYILKLYIYGEGGGSLVCTKNRIICNFGHKYFNFSCVQLLISNADAVGE